MSVILECQSGDPIYCLQKFNASPNGEPFSWSTSRQFKVGERLVYVGKRRDSNLADHPSGWMVLFKVDNGTEFAGTQTYFVTEEGWKDLEKYFHSLVAKPVRKVQANRFAIRDLKNLSAHRFATKKKPVRKQATLKKSRA